MNFTKWRRVAGVAACAMTSIAAVPAWAQAAPPAAPAQSTDTDQAAASTGGLQEVIVTAERRKETLQQAPISVTSVSAQAVKNLDIRNLETLQFITPSMSFSGQVDYAQVYIRGIGTNYGNAGLESPVAFYQDDVYLSSPQGGILDIIDPASVQVLNGPQGTLWGRNASGGVILLNSADPTDRQEMTVGGEYGRFNHRQLDLMINQPLTEDLKLRVAARILGDDGYIHNQYDNRMLGGEYGETVRAKLDWKPSAIPGLDVLGEVEYGYRHELHDYQQERFSAPECLACLLSNFTPPDGFYDTNQNDAHSFRTQYIFDVLHVSYDAGPVTIKSVTGYRTQIFDAGYGSDQDYSSLPLFLFHGQSPTHTLSEDLIFQSNFSGPLNFTAGLTYIRDLRSYRANFGGSAIFPEIDGQPPINQDNVLTQSGSGFIEGSYQVTDDLKLTAGGRYNVDRRILDTQNNAAAAAELGGGVTGINEKVTYYSFTPKYVLSYKTKFGNLYISDAHGFKAGGVNTPSFGANPVISPEKNHSEEIGLKSKWLDNRLSTTVDVFHYTDNNLQVQVTDAIHGGDVTLNAGSSEATGVEFSGKYLVMDGLTLGLDADYLHARFVSFPNASANCPTPAGLVACSENAAGSVLPHSPSFQANLTADYTFPVFPGFNGMIDVLAHWTDSFEFTPMAGGPNEFSRQGAYWLVNVNAWLSPEDDQYRVGIYIDNALDTHYNDFATVSAPFGAYSQAAPPITFGVKAEYRFGG